MSVRVGVLQDNPLKFNSLKTPYRERLFTTDHFSIRPPTAGLLEVTKRNEIVNALEGD